MDIDTVPTQSLNCPSCAESNDLPYFFCQACGSPRARLGKWRTTINLSLAMSAFLSYYYFRGPVDDPSFIFPWAWPLFAVYSALFIQFR